MSRVFPFDTFYMNSALGMACRGVGRTAENPSVGCVVVKDGIVLARARTSDGGRPHAESTALQQAGDDARGATLYVTLEPCTHHGQTPPCVEAIIRAGIKRVVIGTQDVDPRVSGKAQVILEDAGVQVTLDVCKEACNEVISGFKMRMTQKRPFVTLKAACSLDGKIALSNGKSKWITGGLARRHVHQLRSRHDAILVGIDTILADDPMLTTRLDGVEHSISRVVLDTYMRLHPSSNVVQTAKNTPVLLFYTQKSEYYDILKDAGVQMHQIEVHNVYDSLKVLAEQGINRLLVEGGRRIHSAFLRQNLCDELLLYRSPNVLGGDAKGLFEPFEIEDLSDRYQFSKINTQQLDQDVLETFRPIYREG